jgi:hypothetical protein
MAGVLGGMAHRQDLEASAEEGMGGVGHLDHLGIERRWVLERLTFALHTPHGVGTSLRYLQESRHAGPKRTSHRPSPSSAPPPIASPP